MERKLCTSCGKNRLLKFFSPAKHSNGRTYPSSRCKSCLAFEARRRRLLNPTEQQRINRRKALKQRYGLTVIEYDIMLDSQGKGCALCGGGPQDRRLHVDQDHATGMIRGLLCSRCNHHVLGSITLDQAEDIVWYLNNPPAEEIIGERIVPSRRKRSRRKRKMSRV